MRVRRKKAVITWVSISIAAALLISGVIISTQLKEPSKPNDESSKVTGESPDFDALTPRGVSIDDLGGWKKLNPPSGDPFFVFVDKIGDESVNVSQQKLPLSFMDNTEKSVSEFASSFGAESTIVVDGTKVHIGTSAKGPQSVIFNTDEVLVLIKSTGEVSSDAWRTYIKSLLAD